MKLRNKWLILVGSVFLTFGIGAGIAVSAGWQKLPFGAGLEFTPSKVHDTVGTGSPSRTEVIGSTYRKKNGTTDPMWAYTSTGWKSVALNSQAAAFTSVGSTIFLGQYAQNKDATQTLAGSGTLALTAAKGLFPVAGSAGAVTGLGVATGVTDGTFITIIGTSDTNTCQFADAATLNLGAATRTLGIDDTLSLVWMTDHWVETAFVNN